MWALPRTGPRVSLGSVGIPRALPFEDVAAE
jgi:hypothetical protein